MDRSASLAGRFQAAPVFVESVGDCGFRTVFVGCGDGGGQGGGVRELWLRDIVGPVLPAVGLGDSQPSGGNGEEMLLRMGT